MHRFNFWVRRNVVHLLDKMSPIFLPPRGSVEKTNQIGGQGGGPYARQLNIFAPPFDSPEACRTLTRPAVGTADYYHLDGVHWYGPYDLQKEFGEAGKAIALATGHRYVCFLSPDHADPSAGRGLRGWGADAASIYVGFTNDPAILPSPLSLRRALPYRMTFPKVGLYVEFQAPWLVHNPEDPTYPFYLYVEGHEKVGETKTGREDELLFCSSDLQTWKFSGISHATVTERGCTAYQSVYRLGPGNWVSYGVAKLGLSDKWEVGVWTSADGRTFALVRTITNTLDGSVFQVNTGQQLSIQGQVYIVCREDARRADGGMYVSLVPLDANGNIISRDPSGIVRISSKYEGVYPGPTYLVHVSGYAEDGVYHAWAAHGFFSDYGLTWGASYADGGGLDEQYLDYYSFVYDDKLAVQAAPVRLRASSANGLVALKWDDILPTSAYRVYRGSSAIGPWTARADVHGYSFTDASPPPKEISFYKVVTLDGTAERAGRVVRAYASEASTWVNYHIDRALADGADPATIDIEWLVSVDAWLSDNGLTRNLMFWTDPAFGCKLNGRAVVKIYDLGTTRLPRGGDLKPSTSDTVYDALGLNGTVPAFLNLTSTASSYYGSGRFNNVRRKSHITVVAAYKPNSNRATLLSFGDIFSLHHTSGLPGSASFSIAGVGPRLSNPLRHPRVYKIALRFIGASTGYRITATKSLSPGDFQIIAGTFDGRAVTTYSDGVAGASRTGVLDSSVLLGQTGEPTDMFILAVGSTASKQCPEHIFEVHGAQFAASDLILFDTALTPTQITSLTTLLNTRIRALNPTKSVVDSGIPWRHNRPELFRPRVRRLRHEARFHE
jgi:hypothetical protein